MDSDNQGRHWKYLMDTPLDRVAGRLFITVGCLFIGGGTNWHVGFGALYVAHALYKGIPR